MTGRQTKQYRAGQKHPFRVRARRPRQLSLGEPDLARGGRGRPHATSQRLRKVR
jgi:hypothetical protein